MISIINESFPITKSTSYKTVINRVSKYLLSCKESINYRRKDITFVGDESVYGIVFESTLDLNPVKIITEENSDNLYFLYQYKATFGNHTISLRWGYPSVRDKDDDAVGIVSAALSKGNEAVIKDCGNIKKNLKDSDVANKLTVNEIKSTKAYQNIKSYINELRATTVDCTLFPDVYKRIKNRKNIVPVCWISNKDDRFYYINQRSYSSNRSVNRNCLGSLRVYDLINRNEIDYLHDWNYYLNWNGWVVPLKDNIPHCKSIYD